MGHKAQAPSIMSTVPDRIDRLGMNSILMSILFDDGNTRRYASKCDIASYASMTLAEEKPLATLASNCRSLDPDSTLFFNCRKEFLLNIICLSALTV